jgi:hypothetical protein
VKLFRRILFLGALAALVPATAAAYPTTGPNSHAFGNQVVGTLSAPSTFSIHAKCISVDVPPPAVCANPGGDGPFTPNVTVSGPFRIVNNGCTATMAQADPYGSYCYFDVVFKPVLVGPVTGVINVGDASGFGTASVSGTGTAPQAQSLPAPTPTAVAKKKCKKKGHKRSAAAAKKKCRKKHR